MMHSATTGTRMSSQGCRKCPRRLFMRRALPDVLAWETCTMLSRTTNLSRPSNSPMPASHAPYEHVTRAPSRFAQANQLNCFPTPTFAQDEQSQPAEVHLLSQQTGRHEAMG